MQHGFSVDIEDWYHVENFAKAVPRTNWNSSESRVERNVEKLLALFRQKKVAVTCFVLGHVARRYPQMIKSIADAGHEIASHGEDHRLVYSQSPEQFRTSIRDLRSYLEDLTGTPVVGYRAPCFTIVRRTWWALDILAECGYRYDASIFPFQRTRYGVADAPVLPHYLPLSSGRELFEFPPSVLSIGGKNIPIAGGGYFRLFPYRFSRWAFRKLQDHGRQLFFYMHPWEIDPCQPRPAGVGLKSRLLHFLNLGRMEERIERLIDEFSFTTFANLLPSQFAPKAPVAGGSHA